ncbi:Endonuclease/exonuclease/phosphatase [Microstroma glucosiphilum]|uniref:Endonuclease/exonuclease/phosphatase n=1 Tax=Pseudomicrostroma glucosiphilum TaxID=1684307 RepID=A0A316U8B5_9BASI|nr:Endonuclease/exonuclease/phosphatase [Pseudomicrostroma glucosiphilum]PWN21094.1 Endonuclease/exonuclease/phosphatase [Pseudomicrostroma glucosiphilum]
MPKPAMGAKAHASATCTAAAPPPPTKKPSKSKAAALDPIQIEAKRRERADKKEREAKHKAAAEEEARASGLSAPLVDASGRPLYKPRQWGMVKGASGQSFPSEEKTRLKILSWNMLAQGLVRRKLFPGSDALRWKDREAGLAAELTGHAWDVACLQEVDRQHTHGETLRAAGYSHIFAKGYPQKQHGLMLAWRTREQTPASKSPVFEEAPVASQTLFYDDEEVSTGRTGCSRITRNIALFAAIKFKQATSAAATPSASSSSPKGLILATTHLFWHPMHGYERARQAGLLTQALNAFRIRQDAEWQDWPTILAGDFNDQPHSATYSLLTGRDVDSESLQELLQSRVVHQSIDEREHKRAKGLFDNGKGKESANSDANEGADAAIDGGEEEEQESGGEEEEEAAADDQMLKNCRTATAADDLLTFEELQQLNTIFPLTKTAKSSPRHFRSAYATSYPDLEHPSESSNLFSSSTRGRERWDDGSWQEGVSNNPHLHLAGTPAGAEPMWTLYSSLFSLTLDFIFLMPSPTTQHWRRTPDDAPDAQTEDSFPKITRLLRTHRTADIKEGLPRRGVCVSDHIAIGAEVEL